MIAISILLFLIGLCVITMSYAYVQKMAVKLAGFLVEAPVTSAYVIPVEDNTGRVMNEKGKAYIGNKSTEVGIWPACTLS